MEKYGGYTLLKNEAAYKRWHKKEDAWLASPPDKYPAFVIQQIDGGEDGYYSYLYPKQIEAMRQVVFQIVKEEAKD